MASCPAEWDQGNYLHSNKRSTLNTSDLWPLSSPSLSAFQQVKIPINEELSVSVSDVMERRKWSIFFVSFHIFLHLYFVREDIWRGHNFRDTFFSYYGPKALKQPEFIFSDCCKSFEIRRDLKINWNFVRSSRRRFNSRWVSWPTVTWLVTAYVSLSLHLNIAKPVRWWDFALFKCF